MKINIFAINTSFVLLSFSFLFACDTTTRVSQMVSVDTGALGASKARNIVSDYLPQFKSGQTWVYNVTNNNVKQEVTYQVLDVSTQRVLQKVSIKSDENKSTEHYVQLNQFGISLDNKQEFEQFISFGGFVTPQTQVNQSVKLNGPPGAVTIRQSASSNGTTVTQEIKSMDFSKVATESVTVSAGTYQADKFQAKYESSGKKIVTTVWLAKDVGEVKSTQELEASTSTPLLLRELKAFTSVSK